MSIDQKKRPQQVYQDIIEFLQHHHKWWDMNFLIQHWKQSPEQSVEVSNVAEAKEGTKSKVKDMLIMFFDVKCIVHLMF